MAARASRSRSTRKPTPISSLSPKGCATRSLACQSSASTWSGRPAKPKEARSKRGKEREEARKKQEAAKANSKKTKEEQEKELEAKKEEAARKAMEHLRMIDFISHRLPPGAKLELLSDQSGFIENSITEVQINALIGGTMAVLVLFVFLRNVVHTLIVGLTIPVSIMATFAPMYMFDVSLNIMSLGGVGPRHRDAGR